MTKGIVTCNLYKRKGKPSVNAERIDYYVSGDAIEIEDVVLGETKSDYYEGTPTWYKLSGDIYIWSGGVSLNLDDSIFQKKLELDKLVDKETNIQNKSIDLLIEEYDWNKHIDFVPDEWNKKEGENVKIAILDSGVFIQHPNLQHLQNKGEKYFNNACQSSYTDDFPLEDKFGHGTECAGIIAGSNTPNKGINGIAKNSTIYFSKVQHEKWGKKTSHFISAMDYIIKEKIDIVSISVEFGDYRLPKYKEDLKRIFRIVKENNITIIVAARDNELLLNGSNPRFPLFRPETIGIGAINDDFYSKSVNPVYLNEIDFLSTLVKMPTTTISAKGSYSKEMGSSFSTPCVVGILANYLSFERSQRGNNEYRINIEETKNILKKIAKNYSDFPSISNKFKILTKP